MRFSWYFLSRSATREATCIHQFITPVYHASFHWLWKEKLWNHQKVSKHYEYYGTFVKKLFKIKQYIVLAKICQEKWFFWVWFYFMDKSISLWCAIILFLSFCPRLYPKIKSWAGNETWSYLVMTLNADVHIFWKFQVISDGWVGRWSLLFFSQVKNSKLPFSERSNLVN